MSEPTTLDQWLVYISEQNTQVISMGLDRVTQVAVALGVHHPAPRVVTVAGTNGKGSTCVTLEALLRAAGLTVGTTLSPHILQFNERVRVNGEDASDELLCRAFAAVNAVRGSVELTYFEFAVLASLWVFQQCKVQVAILEIGLGGRLDAYNLVDAQVAVITSIGLDHQALLGDDVDTIGIEKAGILRREQTAIFGADLPPSIHQVAQSLGTSTLTLGTDFELGRAPVSGQRRVSTARHRHYELPASALAHHNIALAVQAAETVLGLESATAQSQTRGEGLTARRVAAAVSTVSLAGRFQPLVFSGRHLILDVGHNPLAAGMILQLLRERHPAARVVALFGQLHDKDSAAVVSLLRERVQHWILVDTFGFRAQPAEALRAKLKAGLSIRSPDQEDPSMEVAASMENAFSRAKQRTSPRDVILAFGAFNVVEQVLHMAEAHS